MSGALSVTLRSVFGVKRKPPRELPYDCWEEIFLCLYSDVDGPFEALPDRSPVDLTALVYVNKTFYIIANRILYRAVRLVFRTQLEGDKLVPSLLAFCRTVAANAQLASYVLRITLDNRHEEDEESDQIVWGSLREALRNLVNLKELSVSGWMPPFFGAARPQHLFVPPITRLAVDYLEPPAIALLSALDSLVQLELFGTGERWDFPQHVDILSLPLPNLRHFIFTTNQPGLSDFLSARQITTLCCRPVEMPRAVPSQEDVLHSIVEGMSTICASTSVPISALSVEQTRRRTSPNMGTNLIPTALQGFAPLASRIERLRLAYERIPVPRNQEVDDLVESVSSIFEPLLSGHYTRLNHIDISVKLIRHMDYERAIDCVLSCAHHLLKPCPLLAEIRLEIVFPLFWFGAINLKDYVDVAPQVIHLKRPTRGGPGKEDLFEIQRRVPWTTIRAATLQKYERQLSRARLLEMLDSDRYSY